MKRRSRTSVLPPSLRRRPWLLQRASASSLHRPNLAMSVNLCRRKTEQERSSTSRNTKQVRLILLLNELVVEKKIPCRTHKDMQWPTNKQFCFYQSNYFTTQVMEFFSVLVEFGIEEYLSSLFAVCVRSCIHYSRTLKTKSKPNLSVLVFPDSEFIWNVTCCET